MATATQIAEFRSASTRLVDFAIGDLAELFGPLIQRSTPQQARDVLLEVMPDLVASYGELAAVLGADWYELLRADALSGSSPTVLGSVASTEQVQASTRAVIGALWTDEPSIALSRLSGTLQRLVMDPLRDSIDKSARRDAESGRVAAVSWSRHTRPSASRSGESCDFCVMLAGRGPVYRSAAAAGAVVGRGSMRTGFDESGRRLSGGVGGGIAARGAQSLAASYHDDCHCVAEPTFYALETRPFETRGFVRDEKVLVPLGLAA